METTAYRHEALLYAGVDEFVTATTAFIREGLERDEPTLVVVSAEKISLLSDELGDAAEGVEFADMGVVGVNPARVITAWAEFLAPGEGRRRGIAEPIHPQHGSAAIAECQRTDELLNLCFADADFWLLCSYDRTALPDAVIDALGRSHPLLRHEGTTSPSPVYLGVDALGRHRGEPLSAIPEAALRRRFGARDVTELREVVGRFAERAGLGAERIAELQLAANEVTTNSIVHGGGEGELILFVNADGLCCEVRDHGQIVGPLVGKLRPGPEATGGRGLWLANYLCDLVQLRVTADGSTVRLTVALPNAR